LIGGLGRSILWGARTRQELKLPTQEDSVNGTVKTSPTGEKMFLTGRIKKETIVEGNCEVCKSKPAKWSIYRTKNGKKKWLHVCDDCEEMIAKENLERRR